VNDEAELEPCPCCGAVHRYGRPWSTKTMTVAEYAEAKNVTVTTVNSKIRRGIIKAHLGVNHRWLIPIVEDPL
jgi:hypothetical protein